MIKISNNIFFSIEEIALKFNVKEEIIIKAFDKNKMKYMYLGNVAYVLESEFINLFRDIEDQGNKKSIQTVNKLYPVSEREILTETINILKYKKKISIKELRDYLKETMSLAEEDLIINKNRKDTRFDQKVRNLVCHRSGNGLMQYCDYENGFLILKEE